MSKKQSKSVKTPTNTGVMSNTYNINTLEQVYPFCLPRPMKAGVIVVPCTIWSVSLVAGIKLAGVPQPITIHECPQIFRICLSQEDLELIRFLGYLTTACHGNTFKIWVLHFVGVSQH